MRTGRPQRRGTGRSRLPGVIAGACALALAWGAPTAGHAQVGPPVDPAPSPADTAGPEPADGPAAGPGQWFIEEYGIDALWDRTTGEGVTVAVIDSGVDDSHENLTDVVRASQDFSGSGTDGRTPIGPEANRHHGTAVAGVIAGTGDGTGPTGVAPDAEILSASMWLGSGLPEGARSSREQAAEAIRWSVDNGAQVINMSLGWDDPAWPEAWDEAFAYAYSKDVVVVACVGNSSQGATQAWSPSTVPGVVGVGGLGKDGRIRPPSTAPGTAVDLMGPAEDIPVPYYTGGYAQAAGCSFAAPVISGIVALLRSADPDLSADEVVAALTSTATAVPGHDGRSTPGSPDPIVGWGRVQPVTALESGPPPEVPVAADALADWVEMHRRAPAPEDAAEAGPSGTAESSAAEESAAVASPRGPVLGPVVLVLGGAVAAGLLGSGLVRARRAARVAPVAAAAGTSDAGPPDAGDPDPADPEEDSAQAVRQPPDDPEGTGGDAPGTR
ncbi:S8 family peptidase [Brevibacterium ihuae]|uniref:S8 family peptidase n=1 Tax=Brevibacterium ihuae TaxID=1631743 RepID=UPI000C76F2ED|nr:S8 family serine peptidase [Brevibacterium ihuae]